MAPAAPPVLKDLPASAEDVTGTASLVDIVSQLEASIIKAVTEGKSVTSSNKKYIIIAASEIKRACARAHRLAQASHTSGSSPTGGDTAPDAVLEPTTHHITQQAATTSSSPPAVVLSEEATRSMRKELVACVREEFGRLITKLPPPPKKVGARVNPPPHEAEPPQYSSTPSYAQMASSRPTAGLMAQREPPLPTPRPAMLVSTTAPSKTRQEAIQALRDTVNFRAARYAPSNVRPVSNGKLRVEFECAEHRDDALKRIREAPSARVSAEPARGIRPLLILKGISKDVPSEELADIMAEQNEGLGGLIRSSGDLVLKFIRANRNDNLYNAIFTVNPKILEFALAAGRLCVEHQRVHAREFSPFLQCFSCLQFGHTRKVCKAEEVCNYCASTAHASADCESRQNPSNHVCLNCKRTNSRYSSTNARKLNSNHCATSPHCPVVIAMRKRISGKIEYCSATGYTREPLNIHSQTHTSTAGATPPHSQGTQPTVSN